MNPSAMPWWAWVIVAGVCWLIQLILSIRTDNGGIGPWAIRIVFIVTTVLTIMIGLIRFVKWVWVG